MRIEFVAGVALIAAGCTGEIGGGSEGSFGDSGADTVFSITSPAADSVHVRDDLDPFGALAAVLDVNVNAGDDVTRIELRVDGVPMEVAAMRTAGPHVVRAVGYDADDVEIAADEVAVMVLEPEAADCHDWLDLYQLDWAPANAREGVADPVDVIPPINGVGNRYVSNDNARSTFFMDCELALSLARAASHMRERGVVELADIGVYNYRCIGGGEPPDCPNGISQHAFANAIDIAGFTTDDGEFYSVNDDWVIDGEDEATCDAPVEPGKDAWLHGLICDLKADGVWNIVLTPNYNEGHRNHFHVDLKAGSDFIRRRDH